MEIKSYSQIELAKKEKIVRQTVAKHPEKYIPIQFENWQAKAQAKYREARGQENARTYSIKYIKKSDLDKYFKDLKKSDGNSKKNLS